MAEFVHRPRGSTKRWGSVALGVALLFFGTVSIGVGGFALAAEQSVNSLDTEARGRVPGALTFDAEDRRYVVSLRFAAESLANDTRCEVRRANESVVKLRGDVQVVGVSAGRRHSVGEFDAVEGRTEVDCRFVERGEAAGADVYVSKVRTGFRWFAYTGIGAGLVLLSLGGAALFRGLKNSTNF